MIQERDCIPRDRLTEAEALELLRFSGASSGLILHCEAVRDVAVTLCGRITIPVDVQLVAAGALLHDIGRVRTNGLLHVTEGVDLARRHRLPESICRIIQRHVGAGLTSEEAGDAGLPPGVYMPETVEEKIVAYADNLVYGARVIRFEESMDRFQRQLGADNPVVIRMADLHREVVSWCNGSGPGAGN